MNRTSQLALSLAVSAALAGHALAQNDDCTGAIQVIQGANGPYTNVGSTTSFPWPCAAGGSDVWFVYVAPGTGTLTADTCGSGYDTALEVFDGAGGCGALNSLGCNDDTCGLQSQVTAAVTVGGTYYIRVGGFASSTGTFTLNINGPAGTGTIATATSYGTGCVAQAASFYEHFTATPAIDLSNTSLRMLNLGNGNLVLPSTATLLDPTRVGSAATNLGLTDDSETTVTLSAPMPVAGGTATTLNVCSNGHISTASNSAALDYTPTPAEMLGWANTTWAVWRDMIPNATANVWFEEVGGVAYITWFNVIGYVGTSPGTTPSTLQFQFDIATGNVDVVFGSLDTVSVSGWTGGEGWVVGYSPGGASIDPGSVDLTTAVPATINLPGADRAALSLTNSGRPIGGSTMNLNTNGIGSTAPFGAVLLSLAQFNPGLPLPGMAGCEQYQGGEVTLLFVPLGANSFSTPFAVPNAVGITIYAQSAVYDPASGLTALGAVTSNGMSLFIGNL